MPHIPRAFCADCKVEMPLEKSGVIVETRANGSGYYKVMGDRHVCGQCGRAVITGMASLPLSEHFQPGYDKITAAITVDFHQYRTVARGGAEVGGNG